jgi:hypothetical protein
MGQILKNQAQCKKCQTIITSTHRHDFVSCPCGALSVDGGHEYLRRVGEINDMIELSVVRGDSEKVN